MNNYVEKIPFIKKKNLSAEYFFQSLIMELYHKKLLTKDQMESIKLQTLKVLKEQVGYFTKGQSSSVPVETAEKLMLSIYYVIGIYLKSFSNIDDLIKEIQNGKLESFFNKGKKLAEEKKKEAEKLFKMVKESKVITENYAYNDTINDGISPFFNEYDIEFEGHLIPGSIDYPLCICIDNLAGVEYIYEYLKRLYLENKFCLYFRNDEIEKLLLSYDKKSYHLLINIFELVLTNSIASVLLGKEANSLYISLNDIKFLEDKLYNISDDKLDNILSQAVNKCCSSLNIEDQELIEYINKSIIKLKPVIKDKIQNNKLEKVFIEINDDFNSKIVFSDNEKMDDELFREIVTEIGECQLVEDKIKIIKSNINSFQDLVDVLEADCLFDNDYMELFKSLSEFEIALLLGCISNVDIEYLDIEEEKEWKRELIRYMDKINEEKKKEILSLADKLEA